MGLKERPNLRYLELVLINRRARHHVWLLGLGHPCSVPRVGVSQ